MWGGHQLGRSASGSTHMVRAWCPYLLGLSKLLSRPGPLFSDHGVGMQLEHRSPERAIRRRRLKVTLHRRHHPLLGEINSEVRALGDE